MKIKIFGDRIELFHRKAHGKIKKWECWVDDGWVYSKWGIIDGKTNETKEKGGHDLFVKKVQRKKKKGYVETIGTVVETIRVDDTTLNFDRLPKSFAPAKPIKKVNVGQMTEWALDDKIMIQRKRDGQRYHLVSDSKGRIAIYSSGKDNKTAHLMPLLTGLSLPPKTILDCELTCTTPGDMDQEGFLIVSGIARSNPERAHASIKRAEQDGCKIELFAFDILWHDGQPVWRSKYEDRYTLLALALKNGYAKSINYRTRTGVRRMPPVMFSPTRLATLFEAMEMVDQHKWEGLVLWRKDQATIVQVNGTPARVNSWKLKPLKEEDVIAIGYELGKGKNRNVVGAFNIGLTNGTDKSGRIGIVPMGNCGGGLDDDTRKKALSWKYPCVIQIEYDQRSKKAFRFPIFKRKRDDKKPSDCVV